MKRIYGVGVNDADYSVTKSNNGKKVWMCPYYDRWKGMLRRCYSEEYLLKQPSYIFSYVCNEWLTFSNFKKWMEKQDWKDKAIDKDIIEIGNSEYSPDKCCFISQELNNLFTLHQRKRGKYPLGVSYDKESGKFTASCSYGGRGTKRLGRFNSILEAQQTYITYKINIILSFIKAQTDTRIARGLFIHAINLRNVK